MNLQQIESLELEIHRINTNKSNKTFESEALKVVQKDSMTRYEFEILNALALKSDDVKDVLFLNKLTVMMNKGV